MIEADVYACISCKENVLLPFTSRLHHMTFLEYLIFPLKIL